MSLNPSLTQLKLSLGPAAGGGQTGGRRRGTNRCRGPRRSAGQIRLEKQSGCVTPEAGPCSLRE